MEQIFHGCDIGNPCLGYDNYISWVALLSHEFNEQAKQEQINSIEVTASFVYTNHTGLYKDQVWFLGEMVWPLWQELTLVCPAWKQLLANIKDNLARIKENYSRGLSE